MPPQSEVFLLKSCPRCGGDLILDEGDWLCLQCGRYFYARQEVSGNTHWRRWLNLPAPEDRGKAASGPFCSSQDNARGVALGFATRILLQGSAAPWQ
ncbi:MAG: hypothetical protein FJ316_07925 [SAR202 cluster bacterium]|nr:hypothetical protein [SAR202 cluster bacterium]